MKELAYRHLISPKHPGRYFALPHLHLVLFCSVFLLGCAPAVKNVIEPTDVALFRYHFEENLKGLEEFTTRLYAKNPKYEPDQRSRDRKIQQIFHKGQPAEYEYIYKFSHEVLAAAFAPETKGDRVYLLGLGLSKSLKEAYGATNDTFFVTGLQIPLVKLEKLYQNISYANWRLKITRDEQGSLLFLTNEAGENGYINMGYEVLMTEILIRIRDDIHLRGGLPPKFIFTMSTMFVSIVM